MATKGITEVVKVGRRGELTLSRRVRAAFGVQEGDEMVLSVESEQLVLRRKAHRFGEYLDSLTAKP
ncbi:MAG: AbrB/MazE/SpoVT family DNA-binding domain-containing protein [Deltaproteobacteria bacterium]|nr:AbrB/MazE/SpoVT family DNA-binding domain-containing protein [Deltaproteobacteria bacterium]MBI3391192.1 AbrB/MazE/SpoVT family DNA-binding domain-containing protein [Deltaproteobacteria bacterium]